MALVIVVETGVGLTNSNSYSSIADAKAYCLFRGVDISSNSSDAIAAWLINGADYVESYRARFKGRKSTVTQAMQWPRISGIFPHAGFFRAGFVPVHPGINIDGFFLDPTVIPDYIKRAQNQLVLDQANGVALFTSSDPDQTEKKVKIGPLEVEYDSTSNQSYLPAFQSLIAPLLINGGAYLASQRV